MKHELTALRLREALDDAKLLPVDLSSKSGVSQSSISQYLSGSHAPSNVSSGKMAEILRCNPVWLMGFDAPKYVVDEDTAPLRPDESSLLKDYNALNATGRQEAVKRVRELGEIDKYKKSFVSLEGLESA